MAWTMTLVGCVDSTKYLSIAISTSWSFMSRSNRERRTYRTSDPDQREDAMSHRTLESGHETSERDHGILT